MTRKIVISYNWKRSDGKKIKPSHVEALEESAMTRINELMQNGYVSGELQDNVHMTPHDPEDGISYHGWAEIKTTK